MTTIIYSHKEKKILIDSRLVAGDTIATDNDVKYKKNDKGVWFFTGAKGDSDKLMALNHDDKPEVVPDAAALLASESKCTLVTFNQGYCCYTELDYSFAIGSGANFALGAMDHGSNAVIAMEIAKGRDCNTGGKTRIFNLKNMKFIED